MKLENVKVWIEPTKNPLYFRMGIRVTETLAQAAKLSHAGMAYANLLKDEVDALIDEKGFKPFALATIEVNFYEDFYEEYVYYGPSALKFELIDAEFKGGMGSWDTLLESPLHLEHERKKKETPSSPKPF